MLDICGLLLCPFDWIRHCHCYALHKWTQAGKNWFLTDITKINTENNADGGNKMEARYDERLTPAERRYLEQWKQLEVRRLLNRANESHRDRVQRFNEYLANLSEHYDMPKVGPG